MIAVAVDDLDEALRRARELFLEDPSEEADAELDQLLPRLVDAGFVTEEDYGETHRLWGFTPTARKRADELGFP
jgi:hypothetical protein